MISILIKFLFYFYFFVANEKIVDYKCRIINLIPVVTIDTISIASSRSSMGFTADLSINFLSTVALTIVNGVRIFTHVIPVNRCRIAIAMIVGWFVNCVAVRSRRFHVLYYGVWIISRWTWRSFRRFVVRLIFRRKRNISVYDVVLTIRRVVIGWSQLWRRTTSWTFVFSLGRCWSQFSYEFSEGFPDFVFRMARTFFI